MRTAFLILVLLLFSPPLYAQMNGRLDLVEDKTVLTVWGTHAERGYAHGMLLGEEAKILFDEYIVDHVCAGMPSRYAALRAFFVDNYVIEGDYQTEVEALLGGAVDAGVDMYNATLERDLDAVDMLVSNAVVDLSQAFPPARLSNLGCSSLSSWGSSTIDDPILAGNLVITRLMDWERHPSLLENHLLIVQVPSESDEQAWVSLAFPGFIGSLSAVNEAGVAAFLNVGNYTSYDPAETFYPILFTVRNGIETYDYDGSGENGPADIVSAVEDRNRSGGSIIHVAKDDGVDSGPVVIECNNELGVSVRDRTDNTLIPGDNLAATNHFRTLYAPVYCARYQNIADSLTADSRISPERSWELMSGAAGVWSNLHAVQYVPCRDELWWATATLMQPAHVREPTLFHLEDLLGAVTSVETALAAAPATLRWILEQNQPNPFNPSTTIPFTLTRPLHVSLTVFDVEGRGVKNLVSGEMNPGPHRVEWDGKDEDGKDRSSGIYFYRLRADASSESRPMVLLR